MPALLRRSRSLPGPRNAYALQASLTRSTFFKDRRTPRGGSANLAREWLAECADEQADALALAREQVPSSER
jgi:hypothetical protein